MVPPPGCVLCLVGPEAQQMVGPIAQATVIVAPIVLRDRLVRLWVRVRSRASSVSAAGEAGRAGLTRGGQPSGTEGSGRPPR